MVKTFLLIIIIYCALIDVSLTVGLSFSVSFPGNPKTKKYSDASYWKRRCEDDIDDCFMQICRRRFDRYRCARRNRWREFYQLLFSDLCSYTGRCKKYRWLGYYDDVDVLTCKKDSHCLYDQRCLKGICWDEFQGKRCTFNFHCGNMYKCERRECRLRDTSSQSKSRRFRGYVYFQADDSGIINYSENFGYYCRKSWHCNADEQCHRQKCMPRRQGKRCRYDQECDSAYYCIKRECQLRPTVRRLKSSKPPCNSDYDCGNPSLYVCISRRCVRRKCKFEDDDECNLPYRQGKRCDYITDCKPEYTCLHDECVLGDWDSN